MPAIRFACPECQVPLRFADAIPAGARVQCPECHGVFRMPAGAGRPALAAAPAPVRARDESEWNERRDEPPSGRGLMIGLILGGGLFLILIGGVVTVFVMSNAGKDAQARRTKRGMTVKATLPRSPGNRPVPPPPTTPAPAPPAFSPTPAPTVPTDPKVYSSPDQRFIIRMPAVPQVKPNNRVEAEVPGGGRFVVSYQDIPEADLAQRTPEQRFDAELDRLLAERPGAQLLAEEFAHLDRHPGREYHLTLPGKKLAVVRVYLVNRRLYTLSADGAAQPAAKEFLDSFKIGSGEVGAQAPAPRSR